VANEEAVAKRAVWETDGEREGEGALLRLRRAGKESDCRGEPGADNGASGSRAGNLIGSFR
jgi:hypothetical protein